VGKGDSSQTSIGTYLAFSLIHWKKMKRCRSGFEHVIFSLWIDCTSDKIGLKGYLKTSLVPCERESAHELQ
jgi:hypothetical protein